MSRTCQHDDCDTALVEDADDPLLPDHIQPLSCPRPEGCGERYLLDTETGEMEVDA